MAMGMIQRQLLNRYGYKIVLGGSRFFYYSKAERANGYMEEFYWRLGSEKKQLFLNQGEFIIWQKSR